MIAFYAYLNLLIILSLDEVKNITVEVKVYFYNLAFILI